MSTTTSTRAAAAEQLLDLDAQLRKAQEHVETGADAQRCFDLSDQKKAACENFRARFFPRSGRVVAVHGQVFVESPSGRNVRRIYPAVRR